MPTKLLRTILTVLALAYGVKSVPARAAGLEFEVASIKPAPPMDQAKILAGKIHVGMSIDAARVDIGFMSLADLIRIAYELKPFQLSGPDWMTSQRWDILAKLPEGASKDDVPKMLQSLLAERFKLTIHRETKEHSMYALVVAKGGPKLKQSVEEPEPAVDPAKPAAGAFTINAGGSQMNVTQSGQGAVMKGGPMGTMKMTMADGKMHMEFAKMTLAQFSESLSQFAGQSVVDLTELKGNYQLSLDLSMNDLMNVAKTAGIPIPGGLPGAGPGNPGLSPADAASEPGNSIFTSVQQLGLKLESRKLPTEMIVVDHLEKTPTEN